MEMVGRVGPFHLLKLLERRFLLCFPLCDLRYLTIKSAIYKLCFDQLIDFLLDFIMYLAFINGALLSPTFLLYCGGIDFSDAKFHFSHLMRILEIIL